MGQTLRDLLAAGADESTALTAPGGVPLTFGALRALVATTVATLNAMGIGRNERVGIVLPNGPEMATAFVSVASGATSAPLNPAYRADEFEFYLSDLGARALIVDAGSTSPAIEVARKLGVRIVELHARPERGAGSFELRDTSGDAAATPASGGFAQPDDVALVLHTSGTTSRPKIVPLAQRNVCASARNIREFLALSATDRGLNIMPLFRHPRADRRRSWRRCRPAARCAALRDSTR